MTVTHYASSKGPMEIASMPLRYAQNAHDKLKRERLDNSRDAEIAALASHIERASAEQQVSHG